MILHSSGRCTSRSLDSLSLHQMILVHEALTTGSIRWRLQRTAITFLSTQSSRERHVRSSNIICSTNLPIFAQPAIYIPEMHDLILTYTLLWYDSHTVLTGKVYPVHATTAYTESSGWISSLILSSHLSLCLPRDHLGNADLDEKIILRWIFRKWDMGEWTGSSWFRIGTGGGHLW
jgi:hypothetical protein